MTPLLQVQILVTGTLGLIGIAISTVSLLTTDEDLFRISSIINGACAGAALWPAINILMSMG